MYPAQRSEVFTVSSLVTVLAGFIVVASLLFANAQAIAQMIVSSDLFNAAVSETVRQLGLWMPG